MDAETLRELRSLLDHVPSDTRSYKEGVFLIRLLEHPERLADKQAIIKTLKEEYADEKLSLIISASSSAHAIEVALSTRLREILAALKQGGSSSQNEPAKKTHSARDDQEHAETGHESPITHTTRSAEAMDSSLINAIRREAQRAEKTLPREVLLHELHPIESLWLPDGRSLRTLPDLIDLLQQEQIPPHTWPHFKGQIIGWVREAFQADDLAERIRQGKTQEEVLKILQDEVARLIDHALERTRQRYERLSDLHAFIREAEKAAATASREASPNRREKTPPSSPSHTSQHTMPTSPEERVINETPLPAAPPARSSSSRSSPQTPPEYAEKTRSFKSLQEHPTRHEQSPSPLELPLDHPIPGLAEDKTSHAHHEKEDHALPYEDPFAETLGLPSLPSELTRFAQESSRIIIDEAAVERVLRRHHEQEHTLSHHTSVTEDAVNVSAAHPQHTMVPPQMPPQSEVHAAEQKPVSPHIPHPSESSSRRKDTPSSAQPEHPLPEEGLSSPPAPDAAFYKHLLEQLARREEELQRLEREVEEKLYELLHAETHHPSAKEKQSEEEKQPEPVHAPHTSTPPLSEDAARTPHQTMSSSDTLSASSSSVTSSVRGRGSEIPSENRDKRLSGRLRGAYGQSSSELQNLALSLGRAKLPHALKRELDKTFDELTLAVHEQDFTRAVRLIRQAKRLVKRAAREEHDARLRLFFYELETLEIDVKLTMLGEPV